MLDIPYLRWTSTTKEFTLCHRKRYVTLELGEDFLTNHQIIAKNDFQKLEKCKKASSNSSCVDLCMLEPIWRAKLNFGVFGQVCNTCGELCHVLVSRSNIYRGLFYSIDARKNYLKKKMVRNCGRLNSSVRNKSNK